MASPDRKDDYLEQVALHGAQLEKELRPRRAPSDADSFASAEPGYDLDRSHGVEVRRTGWWRWRTVIVPPNAYVVHTRRGRPEPLHCGLGISFPYDPQTDAYLVVPAAMQTIIINARCICRERQGILVQGYVQWIIDDFKTAYAKLEFSDAVDPMRLVNLQLRQQAEAAIKDVVATMPIDDVLSDKQPIIKELTTRLRHVAEGTAQDKGLGLRIVTVQIKEAVVSSPELWEMLQRPFRAERAKDARLAELTHQAVVRTRESEEEKAAATQAIAAGAEVARLRQAAEAGTFDREQGERVRRAQREAETLVQTSAQEREKLEKDAEIARLRLQQELVQADMRLEAQNRQTLREIEFDAARRRVMNDLSESSLRMRLIETLPSILEKTPQPKEVRSLQIGGQEGLANLVAGFLRLLDTIRERKAE